MKYFGQNQLRHRFGPFSLKLEASVHLYVFIFFIFKKMLTFHRVTRSSTNSLAFGSRYGKSHLRSNRLFFQRYQPPLRLARSAVATGLDFYIFWFNLTVFQRGVGLFVICSVSCVNPRNGECRSCSIGTLIKFYLISTIPTRT